MSKWQKMEAENQRLRDATQEVIKSSRTWRLRADKRIAELEMMIYLYVDGSDIAPEHNPIMRRVIENVQKRER